MAALGGSLLFLGCQKMPTKGSGDDGPIATSLTTNLGSRAVIGLGSSVQLQATPRDAQGQPVPGYSITWESMDPLVLEAEADGSVTAVALGSTELAAVADKGRGNEGKGKDTAPGQLKKQTQVSVDPVQVASVEVSPAQAAVAIGNTVALSAIANDDSGNELTDRVISWSSLAPSIATVDETGTVSGQAAGSVTITATSEGQTGTATVTVDEAGSLVVVDVAVWPRDPQVESGQIVQFYAALLLSDGSVVCEPGTPSTDPAVLFNANSVDGCAEAKALLDYSKASAGVAAP